MNEAKVGGRKGNAGMNKRREKEYWAKFLTP